MPVFQVDLADGRAFEIESDVPPSEQDVMTALGHEAPAVGFDDRMGQNRIPMSSGTLEEFKARQAANSNSESMGAMDTVLANPLFGILTDSMANVPRNAWNAPAYAINALAGKPVIREVGLGESVVPEMLPPVDKTSGVGYGMLKGVEDVGRGLLTPDTVMALGAGASPKLLQALGTLFGVTSVAHLPESAGELGRLSVEGTPGEQAQAWVNTLAQAGIAGHQTAKAALNTKFTGRGQRPIEPEVLDAEPNNFAREIKGMLEAPKEPVIDLEQTGGVYRAPGDVAKQIEGPKRQFVTDEMGQTIPREQFDPMQGQDALAHRQPLQAYRPAPPVIETPEVQIQNTLKSIEAKLNEFVQASKPEPTIIPAYQALGTKSPEPQLSTQEITKLSPSSPALNRPGGAFREDMVEGKGVYNTDPNFGVSVPETSGQTPYNPTPGPGRPSPKQAERQALEEGLGLPSGYYTGSENLPYAKEGQFPVGGGPTGAFSKLQRDRIQAGKEGVRSNERNNPPGEPPSEDPITYRNTGPFTKEQQDAMNAFLRRAIDAGIKAGKELTYEDLQVLRAAGTDRLRKGLPIVGERLPDIRGGATAELMKAGDDAASLPAPAKMIKPEGQSSGVEAIAPQIEDGNVSMTNPGGSQSSLPPAQQAVSKTNNSLEAFAKANGVEYVAGDTGPMILKKVREKGKSGSTVESVKSESAPDKVEIQHVLSTAAQLVKGAEYAGDITKEQSTEFQRRGDEAFANLESNPVLAREQARKLREDASPKNTDPKYGKRTDLSGNLYGESTSQTKGGIGSGLQRAVEKNKEAGAIVNPFRKVNRPIKSSEFQDVQSFKPYADEVFDSTQPHGVGRIPGLSRLFDPRAYRTTPDGEAIIANAVASQKGQNFAALWQERQRDVQRVFETTDGTFKDANGRPAYMSDMIEAEIRNPGSQPLTTEQKTFIKEWKGLRKQIVDMATTEGVQFFVDEHGNVVPINESYFPRQAVGKAGIEETIKENVRKSVGGKQSFMKGRQYETEAEGVKAGIKYEPDEFNRIGRWMASVYKAIADTRLAKDPLMQGRKQGRPKFLEEGQVFQPAFTGRIFPKDVAARLNRYYGEQPYNWLRSLSTINDNLKALQFTLDVSAPFNQGLPLMGVNPARWAKATALSWKALLDDRTMTKYLKDPVNAKAAKTILENNGSLVRLQDFLVGAAEGRGLHNVAPIRASGRSMGTFLTVAKIEMFKAFEPIADKKGWSKTELVEAVENAVLSGKMEMLGLSQGRAMGERLLANAPSYIRGAVNLTAMAGQGKISGKVARRAIVGMAVVISATMYALYKSQGMSDEEIEKRFDPRNPNFYRYPHLMSNGQRVELSYGNIMISLARLAGTSADTVTGKKDYGPGTKGDPWLRWLSYRKSPVVGLALQMYTGEDYRGEPTGKMETLLRSMLPVSMEPLTDKAQESEGKVLGLPESKAIGVGSQLFGLNAFNESKGAFRQRKLEEISQRDYKMPFTKLGAVDRGFVVEEAKELTDKTIDTKTTPRQVMNIVTDTEKRRSNLTKSLSTENQDWLKKNRLEVTSYQEGMSINKREVKLADDDEKKMLQKFMSEETEEAITTLRKNGGEPDQERVNKRLELAHKRAWRRMRDEMEASPK